MGKIGVIIGREFNERVRKKSFIITTIVTPLLFIGLMGAMVAVTNARSSDVKRILVEDNSGIVAGGIESDGLLNFEPTDKTLEQIKALRQAGEYADIYGVLVIGRDIMTDPRNVQLYTYGTPTMEVERGIAGRIAAVVEAEKLKNYDIDNLPQIMEAIRTHVSIKAYKIGDTGAEKESSSGLATTLSYVFGFMIYMFVFLYGSMVLQGVIEEKNSKVLEIMVSSVRPFELMMGKIVGIAAVAVTQFFIWIVFIFVAAGVAMQFLSPGAAAGAAEAMASGGVGGMPEMGNVDPGALAAVNALSDPAFLLTILGGFLAYFIGGYLLYAAMFAAIGSAVDNAADAQQLQFPITIPMILAIIVMTGTISEPHSSSAVWFSMIPLTSPIVMMARLPYGVPAWEVALSIALLYASFIFMVWLAGKIYRVGIFMYGKKPTFRELYKWARYRY